MKREQNYEDGNIIKDSAKKLRAYIIQEMKNGKIGKNQVSLTHK